MKKVIPDEDVEKIMKIWESGTATQKEIATAWNISQSHVSRIVCRLRRQKVGSKL